MRKPTEVLAESIATVIFTVTAFKKYSEWKLCAVDRVIVEEQELNIEMGEDRFRERVKEVIMEIAQSEADRIESEWFKRLRVAGPA